MPHNLLLVEDDPATRLGLEQALTDAGYRVTPVATLRAAVKAFRDELPDAAVVDIRLGAYNGIRAGARCPAAGRDVSAQAGATLRAGVHVEAPAAGQQPAVTPPT
jgi:DNA-binding response OmpR family regulator